MRDRLAPIVSLLAPAALVLAVGVIGSQTGLPEMQGLSLVAANYGLVTRNLGTVSLIGPTRMDYTFAIRSVRGAAAALSEFVEDVYDG